MPILFFTDETESGYIDSVNELLKNLKYKMINGEVVISDTVKLMVEKGDLDEYLDNNYSLILFQMNLIRYFRLRSSSIILAEFHIFCHKLLQRIFKT